MPLLHNRLEIDDTRPLPSFDGPFAKAYAARSKAGEQEFLALVCTTPIGARADQVNAMRGVNHPALLRLREAGSIEWPQASSRGFVFVYDLPLTSRLSPPGGAFAPVKEEPLIEDLAQPLMGALNELSRAGIFFGAVRADNIFMAESQKAVLGDALAQPPGFGQPVVYETAERAMAEGSGRGSGTSSDDFYALGVTLLTALLGEEPLRGMSAQTILNLKLERGSYAALAGERRFSPGIIELLRGLLADDPRQRWGFADFELWASGRRLTPKQSLAAKKANRAFAFAGSSYSQPRQLAQALAANVPQAVAAIKSEELSRWLAHGFNDEQLAKDFEEARAASKRQRIGPEDERLVAHAVLALDPQGPIRYRGLSVFPSGLAASMAQAVLMETPLQPFMEIILNDLPGRWLSGQAEKKPEIIGLVQLIERARELAEKPGLGLGPERVLYEISPAQPCLSPAARAQYALTIPQLLEALDKRGAMDANMVDRHVAAFIMARDKKTQAPSLRAIETGDVMRRGQALLALFADLQQRFGPEKLRGLARALLPLADESVRRFKNRPRQGKIREALRPAAEAGSIIHMLELIDDPAVVAEDAQEYEAAKILYRETEAAVLRLAGEGSDKKLLAQGAGQPLAAALSVGLAFILAAFLLLRAFMTGWG